jgi:hypothetical protein
MGLAAFLALPTAQVYTSTAPWVTQLKIVGSNLVALTGKGMPGQVVYPAIQQGTFAEGAPGNPDDPWKFCGCVNGCQLTQLSWPVTVDQYGNWKVNNLSTRVFPTAPQQGCNGAVMSAIDLTGGWGPYQVEQNGGQYPGWINLKKVNSVATTRGGIYNAWWASAMAAASPDVKEEAGANITLPPFTAGQYVTWKPTDGNFLAPGAPIDKGGLLGGGFPFVAGAIQGHAPGGSMLLTAEIPSSGGSNDILSGLFNALGNICNGGFFDLF